MRNSIENYVTSLHNCALRRIHEISRLALVQQCTLTSSHNSYKPRDALVQFSSNPLPETNMPTPEAKLGALPTELIVLVAEHLDLISILQLSATNKPIHTAIHKSLLFRTVLLTSYKQNWTKYTLEIEEITRLALTHPSTWHRFAIADYLATSYHSTRSKPTNTSSQTWLPALHLVQHPCVFYDLANTALPAAQDAMTAASTLFCRIFSVLMIPKLAPRQTINVRDPNGRDANFATYSILRALEDLVCNVRAALESRNRIWPYNADAQVPYIELPKNEELPIRSMNDTYSLPLPFANRKDSISSAKHDECSDWNHWFHAHSRAMFESDDLLTNGSWCGYYTYFRQSSLAGHVDPPMKNIAFQIVGKTLASSRSEVSLQAVDAYEGSGRFKVSGTMSLVDRAVRFRARKVRAEQTWYWDCQLTPFGIVGFWGREGMYSDSDDRQGTVWLWKEEWTGGDRG